MNINNHLLSGTKGAPTPEVGMECTILMWSDRYAGTIVEVRKNGKEVVMQRDKAELTELSRGMSDVQQYTYERNPNTKLEVFTLRKTGAYVRKGDSLNGTQLRIGDRRQYRDHSF